MARVEGKALKDALAALQPVVRGTNKIPILNCVRLTGETSGLSATATNLDVELTLLIPAENAAGLDAVVSLDRLRRFAAAALTDIEIVAQGDAIIVRSARARASLPTLPAQDWPSLSPPKNPKRFSLTAEEIRRIVDFCDCPSDDGSRPYLEGVYLDREAAISADTHQLALLPIKPVAGAVPKAQGAIPTTVLSLLSAAAKEGDIAFERDMKIAATWSTGRLIAKDMDGTFPDYERAIPQVVNGFADVETKALASAIAATIAGAGDATLTVRFAKGLLTLGARHNESGAAAKAEVDAPGEGELTTGFNGDYLRWAAEALAKIDGDSASIRFEWTDSTAAIRMLARDGKTLRVIMPMRAWDGVLEAIE